MPRKMEKSNECYGLSLFNDEKFCVINGYGTDPWVIFRGDYEVFDPKVRTFDRYKH